MQSDAKKDQAPGTHFTFQRMGGINQAVLTSDYDWQHLDELDPKLWMALSCPIRGLEFNAATLEELDTDHDGRIRAQEVKDAVRWVCEILEHPSELAAGKDAISLENLRQDTEQGRVIASALKIALKKYDGKESLTTAEIEAVLAEAAGYAYNGDGVITLDTAQYAASVDSANAGMPDFITLGMACVGAKKDASGAPGLDKELYGEFVKRASEVKDWRQKVKDAELPLGEKTGEAWTLIQRLAPKLDDYFYRCEVAAYAPEALNLLNEDKFTQDLAAGLATTGDGNARVQLDNEMLATMPLSRISLSGELDLANNLNPAWKADAENFVSLFASSLKSSHGVPALDMQTWKTIRAKFDKYGEALKSRPDFSPAPADAARVLVGGSPILAEAPAGDALGRDFIPAAPNESLDALTDDQINWVIGQKVKDDMAQLLKLDLDAPPLASFQSLRKLSLFHAHLYTFLMNFLSFMDFYDPAKKAIFQSGTLYLDSRACNLCVPVDNIDAHARLADPSHLCLIYCDCSRKETDGAEKTGAIAAALTQGHLADLLDGRHGLFIDNDGKQWDTRIARIVHNPISLEEAVWSPYIRIANMISEQIQKFIASKDEAVSKMAGNAVAKAAEPAKPAEQKGGFDFAKGAGIFAAVSVALSVLSAAFAYIASSVASLGWWWPLALVLVFVCISAPSVVMAWLKLRRRSLGPLLDASGWAVNQGAPINLAMGASLTSTAKLPPNAKCDPNDPYSLPGKLLRKKWRNRFWLAIILLLIFIIGGFMLYCNLFGEPLWYFKLRALAGV